MWTFQKPFHRDDWKNAQSSCSGIEIYRVLEYELRINIPKPTPSHPFATDLFEMIIQSSYSMVRSRLPNSMISKVPTAA